MKLLKKVVLHVGYEKTGTTSLQRTFAEHREPLKEKGILYPRSLGAINHTLFSVFFSNRVNTADLWSIEPNDYLDYDDFRAGFKSRLIGEIESCGASVMIISNEHLSSRIKDVAVLKSIKQFLYELSDDVEIVFYLREQSSLIPSVYSTAVKSGSTESFRDFVSRCYKSFDFEKMLGTWEEVFGKDSVKVRVFARKLLEFGDVVKDFISLVAIDSSIFTKKVVAEQNTSLSIFAVEYLRRLNTSIPRSINGKRNQLRGNLVPLLEMLDDKGSQYRLGLDIEMYQKVHEFYAESNRRISEKYSCNFVLSEFEKNKQLIESDMMIEKICELSARIFLKKQEQVIALLKKSRI